MTQQTQLGTERSIDLEADLRFVLLILSKRVARLGVFAGVVDVQKWFML